MLSNRAYCLDNKLVVIKNDHLLVGHSREGNKSLNFLASCSETWDNDKKKFVSNKLC
jgi:hypothetical protein